MRKGESILKTKKNQKMEQGGKKAVEKLWKTTPCSKNAKKVLNSVGLIRSAVDTPLIPDREWRPHRLAS
jgi:hypothetical protein